MPKGMKKCPACGGIGNVDEAVGFQLDCSACRGTGWVDKNY
jgi:DnaJ-class molecular chaperone